MESALSGIISVNKESIMNKIVFLLLAAVPGFAAEYFVSPSGNDSNQGSRQAPFATISKAAGAAKAGDTVRILSGVYREAVKFSRSGEEGKPIVFAGEPGAIIELGTPLTDWRQETAHGPEIWSAPLNFAPQCVTMNAKMIGLINPLRMEIKPTGNIPQVINEDMLWDKFGPETKRIAGFDLLKVPADTVVTHRYFGERREAFWPVIGNVLCGYSDKRLYLRHGGQPENIVASAGYVLTVKDRKHLIIRDLEIRGGSGQILIADSEAVTVENCRMMFGYGRIKMQNAANCLIKGNTGTLGFIQDQTFQLRSKDDMRGGLLYLFFKYVVGTSLSADHGIRISGPGNKVINNTFYRGLVGIAAENAPDAEVSGNIIREMSSVGYVTRGNSTGKYHDNLVVNCGIPLRLHAFRHQRAPRVEHHYRNLFIQAPDQGGQIFIHCESGKFADKENFTDGKYTPVNPVDGGEFHIYNNTFYGGGNYPVSFTSAYLYRRFNEQKMPFYVTGNIIAASDRMRMEYQEKFNHNLLYSFTVTPTVDPAVAAANRVIPAGPMEKIFKFKSDLSIPDLNLAPDSPAIDCAGPGLDAGAIQHGSNSAAELYRRYRELDLLLNKEVR